MDEFLSERAIKMKAQIEKICSEDKDKYIEYIEKKQFPHFFVSNNTTTYSSYSLVD